MQVLYQAQTRGFADHGWLQSFHTFSFGDYYHPQRMGFGALRVINDDTVAPGMGFGSHPHQDMEIISIPLSGALKHQDSVGTSSVIQKGEVQIMSAGSGIIHSEFNASHGAEVKFLQIWIHPDRRGLKPRYEQRSFSHQERINRFQLLVSPDGREGSVLIHQTAFLSMAALSEGMKLSYPLKASGNGIYLMVLSGTVVAGSETLDQKDGLAVDEIQELLVEAQVGSEILVIEVPL
jgi:quercetin 2,3-dioxygenase